MSGCLRPHSIRWLDSKPGGCESINAVCKTHWSKSLCLWRRFLVSQPIPRTAPRCARAGNHYCLDTGGCRFLEQLSSDNARVDCAYAPTSYSGGLNRKTATLRPSQREPPP
jgi:hypothetical protein